MARRKKKGGRRKKPIPIAATIGLALGTYNMVSEVWKYKGTGAEAMGVVALRNLTGYDYKKGTFNFNQAGFLLPAAGGIAVSAIASKLRMNRYTPRGVSI